MNTVAADPAYFPADLDVSISENLKFWVIVFFLVKIYDGNFQQNDIHYTVYISKIQLAICIFSTNSPMIPIYMQNIWQAYNPLYNMPSRILFNIVYTSINNNLGQDQYPLFLGGGYVCTLSTISQYCILPYLGV